MADSQAAVERIADALRAASDKGIRIIGHFGFLTVGSGTQSWWSIRSDGAVDKLFANPDYKVAQILSVLGSEVRLGILRLIFAGPRTATELVSEMKFGTTGQAYHHLRELERAGYVEQRGGQWHFRMEVGRVYLSALNLAADAGAEKPDEYPDGAAGARVFEQSGAGEAGVGVRMPRLLSSQSAADPYPPGPLPYQSFLLQGKGSCCSGEGVWLRREKPSGDVPALFLHSGPPPSLKEERTG